MAQLRAKQIKLAPNELILGNSGSNILGKGAEATVLKVLSGTVQYGLQQAGDVVFAPGTAAGALSATDVNTAVVEVNLDLLTEVTRATGAENRLSASIVATNTTAGFAGSNGTYVPNIATVYIGSADSLNNADVVLANALFSVQGTIGTVLTNIEQAVGLNGDGKLTSIAGTTYINGDTVLQALTALDTALNLAAGSLNSEYTRATTAEGQLYTSLTVIVAGAGLQTNGSYATSLGARYLTAATSLSSADAILDQALYSLAQAYGNADSTLQYQLSNIEASVGLTDLVGTTDLVAGTYYSVDSTGNTVIKALGSLDAGLVSEVSRAGVAEGQLYTSLTVIVGAAGFNTNGTYKSAGPSFTIIASATSVATADMALDTAVRNEITRATNAEQALGTLVSNLSGFAYGSVYAANTSSSYISLATSLNNADVLLAQALFDENSRAVYAEGTINARLDNLTASQVAYVNGGTAAGALVSTNVQTAIDAVNAKVNAIGSAFEYQGTLANTASAFPTGARNGDVYKITGTGLGTIAGIVVDAGDSVVWDGANWDILIHTEAQVYGTAGQVAVAGNSDVGFTVSIDTGYAGQTSIGTLGTITTGSWNASTVQVGVGGTGFTSATQNGLVFGNGSGALGVTPGADAVLTGTVAGFLQWSGTAFTWIDQAGLRAFVGATQRADQEFAATAGTTTLTLGNAPIGKVEVFINGLKLAPSEFTNTSGSTTVVITETAIGYALATDDVVTASYNYAY